MGLFAATGILKGYDQLLNIVLDETVEHLRGWLSIFVSAFDDGVYPVDPFDPYKITSKTRNLGLTVARGNSVMLICPVDGTQEIENPFAKAQESVME